mmetsp:Transcript_70243/g.195516  ORF Transcript_70243/g.195516 Transcript_70243/m.195516 type:complete len:117 (-) Transcript_70243:230-580(-)
MQLNVRHQDCEKLLDAKNNHARQMLGHCEHYGKKKLEIEEELQTIPEIVGDWEQEAKTQGSIPRTRVQRTDEHADRFATLRDAEETILKVSHLLPDAAASWQELHPNSLLKNPQRR